VVEFPMTIGAQTYKVFWSIDYGDERVRCKFADGFNVCNFNMFGVAALMASSCICFHEYAVGVVSYRAPG